MAVSLLSRARSLQSRCAGTWRERGGAPSRGACSAPRGRRERGRRRGGFPRCPGALAGGRGAAARARAGVPRPEQAHRGAHRGRRSDEPRARGSGGVAAPRRACACASVTTRRPRRPSSEPLGTIRDRSTRGWASRRRACGSGTPKARCRSCRVRWRFRPDAADVHADLARLHEAAGRIAEAATALKRLGALRSLTPEEARGLADGRSPGGSHDVRRAAHRRAICVRGRSRAAPLPRHSGDQARAHRGRDRASGGPDRIHAGHPTASSLLGFAYAWCDRWRRPRRPSAGRSRTICATASSTISASRR